MNPGQLDRRLTLHKPGPAVTAADGSEVPTWEEASRPWARLEPAGGVAAQSFAVHADRWADPRVYTLRYDGAIATGWRLLDEQGTTFEVVGVQEVGRRELLRVAVSRLDPQV